MKYPIGKFKYYFLTQSALLFTGALLANALMFFCCRNLDWGVQFQFTNSYVENCAVRNALDLVISVACILPLIWKANQFIIAHSTGSRSFSFCTAHTLFAAIFLLIALPAAQLFWMEQISSSASVLWNEDYSVMLSTFRMCMALSNLPNSALCLLMAFLQHKQELATSHFST